MPKIVLFLVVGTILAYASLLAFGIIPTILLAAAVGLLVSLHERRRA